MSDLISRQAAIDAINSHFGFNIDEEYGSAVQEVINGLPSAKPEQRWIPVGERLPEDLQPVLVWYEYWHWKAEELKPEYGIGWRFRGLWCGDPGNGSRLRVIAWMPLPEPYKEERDD